jgi:hypothetical protein
MWKIQGCTLFERQRQGVWSKWQCFGYAVSPEDTGNDRNPLVGDTEPSGIDIYKAMNFQ